MKYIKTIFFVSIAVLAVTLVSPRAAFALDVASGGDSSSAGSVASPSPAAVSGSSAGSVTAPSVTSGGNSSSAGSVTNPSVVSGGDSSSAGATNNSANPSVVSGGDSSSAGSVTTPAVVSGGSSSSAGSVTNPTVVSGGNSSSVGTANPGTNPPVTPGGGTNNPGGFVQSGGGSSVSSGTSGGSLPLLTNIGDCNYLTVYLKLGAANPVAEVTKLQNFLKNNEGMNITVTGTFDQATFNAVSAFQAKYKVDVLSPWGIGHTTGFVYYTTTKKINEIFCKKNFALTQAQLKEIEAYRTGIHNTATISNEVGAATTTPAIANATSTNSNQVAGAAKASVGSKIWKFVKTIFGR